MNIFQQHLTEGSVLRCVHSHHVSPVYVCMHSAFGFRLCVCFIFQYSDSPPDRLRYLDQTPEYFI